MSTVSKKRKDPFYEREKEKYPLPIPSREMIMEILEGCGCPMFRQDLFDALEIKDEEQEALGFRLKAMLRDGQLMQDRRGRFCLVERINLLRGRIQAHPDGFGFFIPEGGGDDFVLSPKEMRAVMNGDLSVGDALPSVRQLAKDLLINPNTVSKAYTELVRDGVVDSQQGRGFFISSRRQVFTKTERHRRLDEALDRVLSEVVTLDFSSEEVLERMRVKLEKYLGTKTA